MNLVDVIKSSLGGDVVSKLAGLLGESTDKTNSAVNAALPALLGTLASTASTPDGAARLSRVLDDRDDLITDNFSAALEPGRTTSLAERGGGLLNSLGGGNMMSDLTGALSRFTGLRAASMSSLVGMLFPFLLGMLKKQRGALGLSTAGLAEMLSAQKGNIARAMPSGLGSALSGIPGLGALTGLAGDAAGAVASAGRQTAGAARDAAAATARTAKSAAGSGASFLKWLVPLAAVALVVWLLWGMTRQTPKPTTAATPAITVPDPLVTLRTGVTSVLEEASRTLTSVKDAASARAALPTIEGLNTRLDGLTKSFGTLTASQRGTVASVVAPLRDTLRSLVNTTMNIPGVRDHIGPAVDSLMQKLSSLTT